jgi:nucleoid-associated protein YgaU
VVSLQKAYFENLETGDQLEVQFNPTELTFSKSSQLAEIAIPGLDSPVLQYVRGSAETLSIDLFFDSTDEGMGDTAAGVTEKVDQFYQLVKQNPDTHATPRLRFSWGQPVAGATSVGALDPAAEASNAPFWFTCVVESIERRYVLFSPQGVPLRARLSVRMREYKTVEQMVAHLHSADHTHWHVLKRRERLDQISSNAYSTPSEWRRIAEENTIENPLRLTPGTILKIPPIKSASVIRRTR